jgi:hypothetical protein
MSEQGLLTIHAQKISGLSRSISLVFDCYMVKHFNLYDPAGAESTDALS